MTTDIQKLSDGYLVVNTSANPSGKDLQYLRAIIKANAAARDYLLSHSSGEAQGLRDLLDASDISDDAYEYILAEHAQLPEGVLLCDPDTGRALEVFGPEDIVPPHPVEREDGTMAMSQPQLNPEKLGAVYAAHHHLSNEKQVLFDIQLAYPQLTLHDLRIQTTAGRKALLAEVNTELPESFFSAPPFKTVFDFIPMVTDLPSGVPHASAVLDRRLDQSIIDLRAFNHRYDHAHGLRMAYVQEFCRAIGTAVSYWCRDNVASLGPINLEEDTHLLGEDYLWVLPVPAMQRLPGVNTLTGVLAWETPKRAIGIPRGSVVVLENRVPNWEGSTTAVSWQRQCSPTAEVAILNAGALIVYDIVASEPETLLA